MRRAVGQARVAAQLTRLDPAFADRSGAGLLRWADAGVYRTLVGPGGLSDGLTRLDLHVALKARQARGVRLPPGWA